jgi:amino acid permease
MRKKPTVGSPFFEAFPSICIPKVTNMSILRSFFTVAISIIYNSEFRELSEAVLYI